MPSKTAATKIIEEKISVGEDPAANEVVREKQSMTMDEFESEKIKKPKSERKGLMTELSFGHFVSSMVLILVSGLIFLGGVYYLINKDSLFKGPKYLGPVTMAPISLYLEVSSPETDLFVSSSTVVVSGKTIPEATVAIVSQSNDLIFSANEVGEFSKVFSLEKGLNKIMISSYDNKGNLKSENVDVYYGEEEKVQ